MFGAFEAKPNHVSDAPNLEFVLCNSLINGVLRTNKPRNSNMKRFFVEK